MDYQNFWLIDLKDTSLSVSYVSLQNDQYQVTALGQPVSYLPDHESIVNAADTSLSQAGESISLPQESEPDNAALIVPPYWIDSEGKINPNKNKLIEGLFKGLKLKPMGFIASDEAIVESSNLNDGFPASFVLVEINQKYISVTLIYLGKITKRTTQPFDSHFDPALIEKCLIEFNTESTLPPQIVLTGDVDDMVLESVKNFPWVGKKNVETFLHFPEIKTYSALELAGIYVKTISSQFKTTPSIPKKTIEPQVEIVEDVEPEAEAPSKPQLLLEVAASDLGFKQEVEVDTTIEEEKIPEIEPNFEEVIPQVSVTATPKKKFAWPKIKLPRLPSIKFSPQTPILSLLVISPLLILIPFLFTTAKINLSVTPYEFKREVAVTLDPDADSIDLQKRIVPVKVKTIEVKSSVSTTATGSKETGEKAQGEIVIFNKQEKTQNLPQKTILTDDQGHKFELNNAIQVAPSSSNLDEGVITLGQTKGLITAVSIGPEYNLAKDTKLFIKDFPEVVLVAKVKEPLVGGSRRQIKVVSAEDKLAIDQKLKTESLSQINQKVEQESSSLSGIIDNALQIKRGRVDYSREVGEEADDLTASSTDTVSIFYQPQSLSSDLINSFLSSEPNFADANIDPSLFQTNLSDTKIVGSKIQGNLSIQGKALPKIDYQSLAKAISGKFIDPAQVIIRKTVPRTYAINIQTNFKFLQKINPLPFRLSNITIEVK